MNKAERRKEQLERHYRSLERLCAVHGVKVDGKKLSVKLLKIEREAHQATEDYCNGLIDEAKYDAIEANITERVKLAMGFLPDGFFVNGDPRGCALKINDENMRTQYNGIGVMGVGLMTDWGGYGLLSPDIQG